MTPRAAITAYAKSRGRDRVVDGCLALLAGLDARDDAELIRVLAGEPAEWILGLDLSPAADGALADGEYWPRVWALRGLRWCWDDRACAAVVAALTDHHWRVREMAAKTAGAHGVEAAVPALAALGRDANSRVAAVARAAEAAVVAGTART